MSPTTTTTTANKIKSTRKYLEKRDNRKETDCPNVVSASLILRVKLLC